MKRNDDWVTALQQWHWGKISRGVCWGESAEHTHEGDLVREAQLIVGAPPQGDDFIEATASRQGASQGLFVELL